MATVLIVQPVIEADLPDEQYGYRPARNAHQAVQKIRTLIKAGHTEIVDADLSSYFDTIPHPELLKSLARRIADGSLLKLIKGWLEVPVVERTNVGDSDHYSGRKDRKGTPQGSPLSPLLSTSICVDLS